MTSDADRMCTYREYARQYGKGGPQEAERPGQWHPRRSAHKDWIISAQVVRWGREWYEVGLFLAEDLYLLERWSGVKAGLTFILSDAYYKTGRMELRFVGPVPGQVPSFETGHDPEIPRSIRALAADLGIDIGDVAPEATRRRGQVRSILRDELGRQLYQRITGFSERVLKQLSGADGADLTRACFIVQRGVWSVEQVEYICECALLPYRLLEGGISAERRLSFVHDLCVLRTALMWERVRNTLAHLSGGQDVVVQSSWVSSSIAEFTVTSTLSVPLVSSTYVLTAGVPVRVVLLPRNATEYACFGAEDARAAKATGCALAAVTTDYLRRPDRALHDAGLNVLRPVESLLALDREAVARLNRSVTTARHVTERPE